MSKDYLIVHKNFSLRDIKRFENYSIRLNKCLLNLYAPQQKSIHLFYSKKLFSNNYNNF